MAHLQVPSLQPAVHCAIGTVSIESTHNNLSVSFSALAIVRRLALFVGPCLEVVGG